MPPKKKGNKKAADDWEADLGESIVPTNGDATAPAEPEENEEDEAPAGGLMAMMKKNREKRKKKGLSENFVDDKDKDASGADPAADVAAKAAQEATMDDEFALPEKKGKGGKQNKQAQSKPAAATAGADDDEETGEGGRILTKAEKEKLKKEREKQRKREQVSKT